MVKCNTFPNDFNDLICNIILIIAPSWLFLSICGSHFLWLLKPIASDWSGWITGISSLILCFIFKGHRLNWSPNLIKIANY